MAVTALMAHTEVMAHTVLMVVTDLTVHTEAMIILMQVAVARIVITNVFVLKFRISLFL
jgi:hypothetical protein